MPSRRIFTDRRTVLDILLAVSRSCFLLSHAYTKIIDGVELMFVGIGFIAVPTVVLMYKRINAQRDREAEAYLSDGGDGRGSFKGVGGRYTPQELRKMGDRAPDFRYTL